MPKKRKKLPNKTTQQNTKKWYYISYLVLILLFLLFHYKDGIKYYIQSIYEYVFHSKDKINITVHDIRAIEIMEKHQKHLYGFDVSHYQCDIDWKKTDSIYEKFPLDFVFIRSTMGIDGKDAKFQYNWKKAKSQLLVRGAYHYYRPDENSTLQAQNFITNTPLEEGDFVPILDIEDYPKTQSVEKMIQGINNWLKIVETHYGEKPIIYSGENFYNINLKKHFPDHKIWIAKYSLFSEKIKDEWHFWQFTDKGKIPGINTPVDLNIFNGNRHQLKKYLLQ